MQHDLLLNHFWTPRPLMAATCVGSVFLLLAVGQHLEARGFLKVPWLVAMGRTSLMIYFVHHGIVLSLGAETLGLSFTSWWRYGLAVVVLHAILVGMARGWLEARPGIWRRLGAPA